MKLKYCIRSMRLRTLPLSLAGTSMGMFLAASHYTIDWRVAVTLIITTISLQILSNLSNELGDALNGTDSAEERQGMHYSIMDGGLTYADMKKLIAGAAFASMVAGLLMILFSFGTLRDMRAVSFLCLGVMAIWAAMHYTLGSHPYGYRGLGDVSVFIFFGVATVLGGYLLCAHTVFSWLILLPTAAIGCFSVGVLNVNNIRDMKTDAATRVTVALKLGLRGSRIYQTVLIASGWVCMVAYSLTVSETSWWYLLTLPLFVLHLHGVWTRQEHELDGMLPLLVMSSLAFSLTAGVGML